jgi:hypothetical protein
MLVFSVICTNCGCQIGAYSLLYVWLRNRKFEAKQPRAYEEVSYADLAAAAGIIEDCCWAQVHSTYTHQNRDCGIVMVTADGVQI